MKIKIRYDNKLTEVEIPDDDYTLMLDIDYEMRLAEAPEAKKEEIERCNTVQEMFDLMNKTEYNNWHKLDRHSALTTTPKRIDGKTKNLKVKDFDDNSKRENTIEMYPDCSDEEKINRKEDYENVCRVIRENLKPNQAELLIAIYLDGISPSDYAELQGVSKSAISHRLNTAKKNFKKIFPKPSTFTSSCG